MAKDDENWWCRPLQRPRALTPGDKVAIVSPCWGGPATFPHRYQAGKRWIEAEFGLQLIEMPNCLAPAEWLDKNPHARADDLMLAFSDPSIAGIIASIGGDDAIRLIPHIDLSVIRDNPKVFLGYSDPTVLHFACLKAGVGSFHGPTIMSGFAENAGMSVTSSASFFAATFSKETIGWLPSAPEGWTVEHLGWHDPLNQQKARQRTPSLGLRCLRGSGSATGPLIGGCAEVLEMLKGTPWWPPLTYWDGAIFFYETSEDAPSDGQVLRWMRNFAAQGILSRISGIILGRPGGPISDDQRKAQELAVLRALDEAELQDLPVIADLDIGHTDPILTLPYGATARIECQSPSVTILDAGVT
jgi:muramoyltetrapeptide carboxypeptidase LdcA involved in peptidoglycan recycling